MYRGFIISCGGSFESSWRSGLDFGTRIHYRESFIMSKLVTMCGQRPSKREVDNYVLCSNTDTLLESSVSLLKILSPVTHFIDDPL